MAYTSPDYDDIDYVQVSQRCEICGDRWFDDRPLKQWSLHPQVTVHEECDFIKPPKKKRCIIDLTIPVQKVIITITPPAKKIVFKK